MKTIRNEKKGNYFLKMLFLLALPLVFTACSKDDDSAPQPTVRDLLTKERWYLENISSNSNLTNCEKQTNVRFLESGIAPIIQYGMNNDVCTINNSGSWSWELISDTEILIETGGAEPAVFDLSISETTLTLTAGVEFIIFDKIQG